MKWIWEQSRSFYLFLVFSFFIHLICCLVHICICVHNPYSVTLLRKKKKGSCICREFSKRAEDPKSLWTSQVFLLFCGCVVGEEPLILQWQIKRRAELLLWEIVLFQAYLLPLAAKEFKDVSFSLMLFLCFVLMDFWSL